MLTQGNPEVINLNGTDATESGTGSFLGRRIWLPKILYDFLPYFYLTAGFAALFATLYISEWFWVLPHYLLFAAACLHLGSAVHNRRKASANQRRDQE